MSQVSTSSGSTRALALDRRRALSSAGKAAMKATGDDAGQSRAANTTSAASTASAPRSMPSRNASPSQGGCARTAALARRKAMSSRGKTAVTHQDRTRTGEHQQPKAAAPAVEARSKADCGCGCGGAGKTDSAATTASSSEIAGGTRMASRAPRVKARPVAASSTAKIAALARRQALSSRGKAGVSANGMSAAQTARAGNPKLSGRELAQFIREQRSKTGGAGQKKAAPAGRQRNKPVATNVGAAQDAPWKVGASQTTSGQTVTGTMVGRHDTMTGDEPSTCRTITGTEYLGADIFSKFCQTDAKATTARKVMVTSTSHGNAVSGNRMGRSSNVTGNEPGTCKNVTGTEYISAEQTQGYCGEFAQKSPRKVSMAETLKGKTVSGSNVGRSEKVTGDEYGMRRLLTGTQYTKPADIGSAPSKVGASTTLRGGNVTGTLVGRREKMTGDEAGSCRNITGDDYIGQEQYSGFCEATPKPTDRKVNVSQTLQGRTVTGSLGGRSSNVTGDEPGTCKAVTGTPYAGSEQYPAYCEAPQTNEARARMQKAQTWGKPLTGLQPGIGGRMTGAAKGACEPVSGTPYVGADQAAQACPATAAEPGSPDFPQTLGQTPWGQFSVEAPVHASYTDRIPSTVTGSQYERGDITGPFGMAAGKVTGTEQARFDRPKANPVEVATAESIHGRVKPRISGEGMDAGSRITGDDWDRGDRVTGTEGRSATRRNPTLRGGPMSAMQSRADMVRPDDIPKPVSKVTGGSGNTEKGALITYSGGARG